MNNYNLDLSECTSLTLISSESCNLNCAYCVIANSIDKKVHNEETQNIKNSFINGSFLHNIQTIGKKYNLQPEKITKLDLWGQEPTLTLDEFSIAFKEFYEYLPNLDSMFFSTNGVAFPERIINLIKMLENTVNNNFVLEIQFSYDGYKPTRESRGIDPNIIINNLKTIITTLNQMTLNKVRILISCHNVVNEKIFNQFGSNNDDNDKEFLEYLKELNDLPYSLINLNKNQSLEIVDHFSPGIVTPYNATKEEGKNLTNFILKADKIGTELESQWWRGLMYQFDESLRHNHCFTLDIIPELMNGNQDLAKYLSNFCGCGYGGYDFKLRYDGTAVHCQNSVGMLKNSSLVNRNDLSAQLHLNLIKKNYFPNFLTDSKKDIEKFLLRSKIAKNSSYPCFFSEVLNLMVMLLNSQQIDESYNDYEKLFRHGMIISQNFICWDNCLTSTGSGFGKYAGEIRLYCNGFLDLVESSQEEFKEKFCKGVNNEN